MTQGYIPQADQSDYKEALKQLNHKGRRREIPFVQQMQMADCGAASLAMVLRFFGRDVRLDEVRQVIGVGRDGATLGGIRRAGERYGLRGRGVRLEVDDTHFLPRGAILHWNLNHFVVFDSANKKGVKIVDPAMGRRTIPWKEFRTSFTGVALVLDLTDSFVALKDNSNRLYAYFKALFAEKSGLTRILTMSVLLRVIGLGVPMLTALVVDRIVPRSDYDLLLVVGSGLVMVMVFQIISTLIRSHLLLELRTKLDVKMTLGFLEHLVSLPFKFFQTRSAGDLMMRVNSNAQMRELVTSSAMSGILDGILVLVYLLLIFGINVKLAAITTVLAVVQAVLYWLTKRKYRELMTQSLESQAQSQSFLVQLITGIETLKCAGAEQTAVVRWSNYFARSLNVGLAQGRLKAAVDAFLGLVKSGSPLIILGYGATLAMSGEISLGTMLALNSLAIGFLTPMGTLVDNLVSLHNLGSYIERLDDVFNENAEQDPTQVQPAPRLSGHIRLNNVSFRYNPGLPPVVREASLEIRPGMKVAFVGPSGSGKSTLAKLMLGLYWPEQGTIEFDGRDLRQLDVRTVRRQMGIVSQQPFIFAGSVRENIALNDPDAAPHQITRAAQIAGIHQDILQMPMGYETPISEGGASMSGGQRQRLALARALVGEPSVLLLDEATSALDAATEAQIVNSLKHLRCTQLVIAHRLSTIVDADLILVVDKGCIVEAGTHQDLVVAQGHYHHLVSAQANAGQGRALGPSAGAPPVMQQLRPAAG